MILPKAERLQIIVTRLKDSPASCNAESARAALEKTMREVEDEFSGIAENSDADKAPTDGRMYPPHDRFEKVSPCAAAKLFKQRGHETWIGENGAIKIKRADGVVELDKSGSDGKTIDELMSEGNQ